MTTEPVQLIDQLETIVLQEDPLYVVEVILDGGPSAIRWPDGRVTRMGDAANAREIYGHLAPPQLLRLLTGLKAIGERWVAASEELGKHDGPSDLLPDYLK